MRCFDAYLVSKRNSFARSHRLLSLSTGDEVTTFGQLKDFQTQLPLSVTEPVVAQHKLDTQVQVTEEIRSS